MNTCCGFNRCQAQNAQGNEARLSSAGCMGDAAAVTEAAPLSGLPVVGSSHQFLLSSAVALSPRV